VDKGQRDLSNRYTAGTGWGQAVRMSPNGSWDSAGGPSLAVAPSGEAVGLWGMYNNTSRALEVHVYRPGSGWGPAHFLLNTTSYYLSGTDIAINRNLQGAMVWTQGDNNDWDVYMATFDLTAIAVAIDTPASGTVVGTPTVPVTGHATTGANVSVNGIQVAVDENGAFSLVLPLLAGANDIVAVASDAFGAVATDSVSVTFDDPIPGLRDDLNETRDAIDNLSADLNATRDALQAARDALNATLAELAAAQAEVAAAQAQVADLQAQVAGLEANLSDLQGQLDGARADLSNVTAQLDAAVTQLSEITDAFNAAQAQLAAANATIAALGLQVNASRLQVEALQRDLDARAAADAELLEELNETRTSLRAANDQLNGTNARLSDSEEALASMRAAQAGMTLLLILVALGLVATMVVLQLRSEREMRKVVERIGGEDQRGPRPPRRG
jgi:predicted  nucleic acid-binding Zn-ribbon protein